MKKSCVVMFTVILFLFSLIGSASAVPNLISYQGVLNDQNGIPISDTREMILSIYSSLSGGSALWTETQSVMISNGLFNIQLGSVQQLPVSIFHLDALFLGIRVGADTEMTPRQLITNSAYSMNSQMVSYAALPIGTIMAWAKTLAGVPALNGDWVECKGQMLSDVDSPLNGQIIPNLNGQKRFLRGYTSSGGTGGHEFQNLNHDHDHTSSDELDEYRDHFRAISGVEPSTTLGNVDMRPPFYNVVWIMKIK